nr:YceH family protein [Desulfobulbaceae bacterium]
MDIMLNDIEARVLGCLIEKSMTTPDYYPLSLVSLTTACNQKSSRNPVMSLEETTVVRALDSLKSKRLVVQGESGRVPKYSEIFVHANNFVARESSLLMVMLLRGPQTVGELRTRTERAYSFESVEEVEQTLADLIEGDWVVKLPRLPGRKEPRYMHLLMGEPEAEAYSPSPEPARLEVKVENEKVEALVGEIERLREEISQLKSDFEQFKSQFE